MLAHLEAGFAQAARALEALRSNRETLLRIERAGEMLVAAFKTGGRAYSAGNGGSMCDAMHFAEELSGRFRKDRPALPALAISDAAHLTCAANDFGFDSVFSRFLEAHIRPSDVFLAISTSGKSPNILAAARVAKDRGAKVIALTGRPDAALAQYADIHICTPAETTFADRVQELHIKVIHMLIELCERSLFPGNYP